MKGPLNLTFCFIAICIAISVVPFARADVGMSAIFNHNMVLQRDMPVAVFGWAAAGEEVAIALQEQSSETSTNATIKADEHGNWRVVLPPKGAGGNYQMTVKGNNTITFGNITFGEVWICSGQSNMDFPVKWVVNPKAEIAKADYPNIRLISVPSRPDARPQRSFGRGWVPCTAKNIEGFSAVAYYFGRKLHQELDGVPIGLVNACWSGSACEAWINPRVVEQYADYKLIVDRVESAKPWNKYGQLYNSEIVPLLRYSIRGAIWYQGETNTRRAYQYRTLFPLMINNWREEWQQGDFSFYFVQLASYKERVAEPTDSDWAELREAQSMTLSLPNTGQAVTIDIGDAIDVHPKNKHDVGYRLALQALDNDYGFNVVKDGPVFEEMKIEGNKAILRFSSVDQGLVVDNTEKSFAVAGLDRKFYWGDVELVAKDTLALTAPQVAKPIAVRYAWQDNPPSTLRNKGADLPASPFRTDMWPGATINAK